MIMHSTPPMTAQHVLVFTQNDVALPVYGGALRVAALVSYMRAQGVTVSVVRFRAAEDKPSPPSSGVHDLIVPPLYSLAPVAAAWHRWTQKASRIAREINSVQPVTIVQSDPPWTSLAARKIARRLSVPHVVMSQNCETALAVQFSQSGPARKIPVVGDMIANFNISVLRRAEKQSIESATHAFTPSEMDLREMSNAGIDSSRVKILPNGTTVRYLSEEARVSVRARHGIGQDEPLVIFLGRMDYPPNLQAIHTILQRIAPSTEGVRFMLVGSNPPALDLPANVTMIGRVDSVDEYLRAADLSVVPIEQGSGTRIKILDAWAAGLPVLSTRAGASGLDYRHGENIFIEDAIDAFPMRIAQLIADPALLRQIGEGARAASEPYRWDTIAPGYLNSIIGLTAMREARQPALGIA